MAPTVRLRESNRRPLGQPPLGGKAMVVGGRKAVVLAYKVCESVSVELMLMRITMSTLLASNVYCLSSSSC